MLINITETFILGLVIKTSYLVEKTKLHKDLISKLAWNSGDGGMEGGLTGVKRTAFVGYDQC